MHNYLICNGIFLVSEGCGTGIGAARQFWLCLGIVYSSPQAGAMVYGGRYESLSSSKFFSVYGMGFLGSRSAQ